MKIGIIAATGKAGNLLMNEAIKQGNDVTAIVRHPEKLNADVPVLEKGILDLTTADVEGFDVLIDAFNAPVGQEELHVTSTEHLIDIVKEIKTRVAVVGGAGSLYVDDAKTMQVYQAPDFPDSFKPTASAQAKSLSLFQQSKDVNWLFVSPAANFDYKGAVTGQYQVNGDVMLPNAAGDSMISYGDFAKGFIDALSNPAYQNQRISLVSK